MRCASTARCPVKFAARAQQHQVIANVYVNARWDRVEHFHGDVLPGRRRALRPGQDLNLSDRSASGGAPDALRGQRGCSTLEGDAVDDGPVEPVPAHHVHLVGPARERELRRQVTLASASVPPPHPRRGPPSRGGRPRRTRRARAGCRSGSPATSHLLEGRRRGRRQPQHPLAEPAHRLQGVIEGPSRRRGAFSSSSKVLVLDLLGRDPRHDEGDVGRHTGLGERVVSGPP